jgi:hypothetical protein
MRILFPPINCMSRAAGWPMGTIQFFDWSRSLMCSSVACPLVNRDEFVLNHKIIGTRMAGKRMET